MTIEQALKLQVGSIVRCPADRGDLPYTGRVTRVSGSEYTALDGSRFVWVHVCHPSGTTHVWPSNRLS